MGRFPGETRGTEYDFEVWDGRRWVSSSEKLEFVVQSPSNVLPFPPHQKREPTHTLAMNRVNCSCIVDHLDGNRYRVTVTGDDAQRRIYVIHALSEDRAARGGLAEFVSEMGGV